MRTHPEPTPIPDMQYPTRSGDMVTVTAIEGLTNPYRWSCTCGDLSDLSGSLPLTRRGAIAHADSCDKGGAS